MKILNANISQPVFDYLQKIVRNGFSFHEFNNHIKETFGLYDFCASEEDYVSLSKELTIDVREAFEEDRAEYGDFQTPLSLALKTCRILKYKDISPKVCIEPTCGKGSFLIAAIREFPLIQKLIGVEIYKPYVWESKFNILDFYLKNKREIKPTISIIHTDIFSFDFHSIPGISSSDELLLIGNPPWVTNSKLGQLDSKNLPRKSNIKGLNGMEAITGKSNFDIAEFILIDLFKKYERFDGHAVFLIKNSVIKNIIEDSKNANYRISKFEQYEFDAKKEFGVATDASAFVCALNHQPDSQCSVKKMESPKKELKKFGWHKQRFVSNIEAYQKVEEYDGKCLFEWRSGIKHDCSSVFELKRENGRFINKANEVLNLEDALIYPLIKSSQLKKDWIDHSDNYVIITQKKVGQPTDFIARQFPNLYSYLNKKREIIASRKSSVYRDKPPFSIFGVGDYTFKPYKIAISGLYKKPQFSLLTPNDGKPLVTDDTCYIIGFEDLKFAIFTFIILTSDLCINLLDSLTFKDTKRVYTKEVLMRIDLKALADSLPKDFIMDKATFLMNEIQKKETIDETDWFSFKEELMGKREFQMSLFGLDG